MNDNLTQQIVSAVVNSANPFPAMSATGSKVCHDLHTVDSVATDNRKNLAASEITVRLFKDNVLARPKAYNVDALVDFVCTRMKVYYRK